MLNLVYRAAIPFYYRRTQRFLAGARQGRRAQHDALFAKLRRCASSDFGQKHGFSKIRSIDEFRRQVPITDYEYVRPYVQRVMQGDLQAMFNPETRVLMFALTSGTTSQSKFVPVTREFLAEYRASWYVWGSRNYKDHLDQFGKTCLQLTSNWQQYYTEAGIPCGNISGLASELAPWFTRPLFVLPRSVIRIDHAPSKHYTALRLAMASPRVGMMITANPSTLLEFARRGDAQRESLIKDIFDGTLRSDLDIPSAVREALARHTGKPNPQRARQLERIAECTGRLYPRDYWPELSHLAVWMGGSVGVYVSQLPQYYGRTTLRDHGLSASEGRMTIPIQDDDSTGILDYVHHYYEFIPKDEIESEHPTVLEAHELEVDQDYFILLTTSAGMYRYDIHDLVRCIGYEGQVPLLQFLNKGAHFSSITGEKLSEFQVVSAVRQSFAELQLPVEHFTVAPRIEQSRPGYVLLLEPSDTARDDQQLAERVEAHLSVLNCEYGDKRESGRLRPLAVHQVPPETWSKFRNSRTQRGNLEEYKHPCLVNDLEFVDKLLDQQTETIQAKDSERNNCPLEPSPRWGEGRVRGK